MLMHKAAAKYHLKWFKGILIKTGRIWCFSKKGKIMGKGDENLSQQWTSLQTDVKLNFSAPIPL